MDRSKSPPAKRSFWSRVFRAQDGRHALAENRASGPPTAKEMGWTGTDKTGGQIDDDHNTNITRDGWIGNATTIGIGKQMYKEDSTVKAIVLSYVKAHIQNTWIIQPADDTPEAKQVAAAAETVFLDDNWDKRLFDALMMVRDGVRLQEYAARWDPDCKVPAFAEKEGVLEEQDKGGKVGLYKLDFWPRLPHTIEQWLTAPDGSFDGIQQTYRNDDSGNHERPQPIPADRILRFSYDQEGSNWQGEPLIRASYSGWRRRRRISKDIGIAADRAATGTPLVKQTDKDAQILSDQWENAYKIAREFRNHENQFLAAPYGMTFELLESKLDGVERLQRIFDLVGEDMARGCGCMHLYTGKAGEGSLALFGAQVDLFLMNAMHLGDYVCDPINRLIERWCEWNGWSKDLAPKLTCGELAAKDVRAIAETLKVAKDAGVFTKQMEDEEFIRDAGGLPDMSKETRDKWKEPDPEPPPMMPPIPPNNAPVDGEGTEGDQSAAPPADESPPASDEPAELADNLHGHMLADDAITRAVRANREAHQRAAAAKSLMCLLGESYFLAQSSRIGREDLIAQIAFSARPLIAQITEDYAARVASAGNQADASKVTPDPRLVRKLEAHFKRGLKQAESAGAGEVKAEIKRQKSDPDYPVKFREAIIEIRENDNMGLATIGKKSKNPKGTPVDDIDIDEFERTAAKTSAQTIAGRVQNVGRNTIQTTAAAGAALDAEQIMNAIATDISSAAVARQIQPDINGTYAMGRQVQMRREDVDWGIYTTTPELSSQVCDVCLDTESGFFGPNPFSLDNPAAPVVPNPDCMGNLSGNGNPCWCAIIPISAPPEGEVMI